MNLAQQKIKQAVENCNPEEFSFREEIFCGEEAILVNPALQGTKWTQENKYLRSVIYRKSDYKVLSSSFFKFCNWGENPENFPIPDDILDARLLDKIDGCLDKNTKVTTENGEKTIQEVCLGDDKFVMGYVNGENVMVEIMGRSIKPNNNDWYMLELVDGKIIKLTGNHLVFLPNLNCYREVKNLKVGDDFLLEKVE